jgi:hypothetical protein
MPNSAFSAVRQQPVHVRRENGLSPPPFDDRSPRMNRSCSKRARARDVGAPPEPVNAVPRQTIVRLCARYHTKTLERNSNSSINQTDTVSALSGCSDVFVDNRHGQYRFSILLIDDKSRIGLEGVYRITMCNRKENDMTRFANTAFAACAAVILSLASIGAIVIVPSAQAANPAMLTLPSLA